MTHLDNALAHYYDVLKRAMNAYQRSDEFVPSENFLPDFDLPVLDSTMEKFLQPSGIGITELGEHGGCSLHLLNLMSNPGTRTTKTFGSMINVARAVNHIRTTGERVFIISPSSGNKATALRNAVERAVSVGLVGDTELQIATAVPEASRHKLWSSGLSDDPRLRELNPMAVLPCEVPVHVKLMIAEFMARHTDEFHERYGIRLWHTLELRNYMVADMVRALAEHDLMPATGRGRLHAHAVSSALGLLGLQFGHRELAKAGVELPALQLLLVQHLGTPDMVLGLYHDSFDMDLVPKYRRGADGLYRQDEDPHFPAVTFDPEEHLDATFYSRTPVTSPRINKVIRENGGGGIVVSLYECLQRYNQIRDLLATSVSLPADPRRLREWSLVMALTGVLNGIERGVVADREILVHASGSYGEDDYRVLSPADSVRIDGVEDFYQVVRHAAEAG
ncbi:hypothetical protein SAMN05421504_101704 [Amycolatopsis xylanica]|uniref:Uncharacterized protein n=1 Tax=Amycolatopsis xylanica TaxID=589385 RepID=A0A1H2TW55_9PSEU|nr:DUF6002 family protein [Amycolatopsis xylanica]SDW48071.1 hypothetical protein SAMN05421504_101704 [Amycolatopsis xylanica]